MLSPNPKAPPQHGFSNFLRLVEPQLRDQKGPGGTGEHAGAPRGSLPAAARSVHTGNRPWAGGGPWEGAGRKGALTGTPPRCACGAALSRGRRPRPGALPSPAPPRCRSSRTYRGSPQSSSESPLLCSKRGLAALGRGASAERVHRPHDACPLLGGQPRRRFLGQRGPKLYSSSTYPRLFRVPQGQLMRAPPEPPGSELLMKDKGHVFSPSQKGLGASLQCVEPNDLLAAAHHGPSAYDDL